LEKYGSLHRIRIRDQAEGFEAARHVSESRFVCLPVLGRMKKEKENLQIELKRSHMEISKLRREIEDHKGEKKRLRQDIRQADMDISRQKKDIDNAMNERDILGTQLVRRNDELSLQYSRIKVCRKFAFHQRAEGFDADRS